MRTRGLTIVSRAYIEDAPEWAQFYVVELNAPVRKRFAIFHAIMGRMIAIRT